MPYKKIAFFAIIIILLLTINDLAHSIYDIWQKQDLIVQAQKELLTEQKESKQLKNQIAQVRQPQFVESQARDKLLLAKPGEGVIVIPSSQLNLPSQNTSKPKDMRPNWQKWWEIFF
ncbi:MAG TPA: septum formation initiator family protein [Candidatus Saccharimonadales bacterium]|nr:septum formation initiator family protein [Candidatus Saccharimonadales bacterium]